MSTTLNQLLTRLSPISLEEMSSIRLMNRTDTKFLTDMPRLLDLLQMVQADYWVQEIKGERNMQYSTVYFDTSEYAMFRIHQAGHSGRQKLRFRTYVSSGLQFMEVKTKNNHGRTHKKRMKVTDMDIEASDKRKFLTEHLCYRADTLQPSLQNSFDRITLVNRGKTERLTIDTNLQFHNLRTLEDRHMGPLVVVELKRDGLFYSPILEMLRSLRIQPHGFSKYCMGTAFTHAAVQVNQFKMKMRDVERLIRNSSFSASSL